LQFTRHTVRLRRRPALFLAAAALLALAVPVAAEGAPGNGGPKITVMTRNVYLGADLGPALQATTLDGAIDGAGEVFREVDRTNFPERAVPLAREIKRSKADLIGLQEVALWRRGPAGVQDGPATPATQVVYDFLRTLRRELARAGLRYRLGSRQQETDIEAPIDAGYDVRLTMFDAILVKRRPDLRIRRALGTNYDETIGVRTPGSVVTSTRGWTAVDVTFKRRRLRLVNTHLESFYGPTREAQARELVAAGGPLDVRGQKIVTGDMNSDPLGRESDAEAFNILRSGGLVDTWPRRFGPGFTCCLNQSDARDPDTSGFDHRIDLVMAKPRLRAVRGVVVGDELRDRAANGLWPSDHAGAVVTLRLR